MPLGYLSRSSSHPDVRLAAANTHFTRSTQRLLQQSVKRKTQNFMIIQASHASGEALSGSICTE